MSAVSMFLGGAAGCRARGHLGLRWKNKMWGFKSQLELWWHRIMWNITLTPLASCTKRCLSAVLVCLLWDRFVLERLVLKPANILTGIGRIFWQNGTMVRFDKALRNNRGKSTGLAELCSELGVCVQSKDVRRQGRFGKSRIAAFLDHCKPTMGAAACEPPSLKRWRGGSRYCCAWWRKAVKRRGGRFSPAPPCHTDSVY